MCARKLTRKVTRLSTYIREIRQYIEGNRKRERERERERCCVSTYLCAVEESVMDQERERDRER